MQNAVSIEMSSSVGYCRSAGLHALRYSSGDVEEEVYKLFGSRSVMVSLIPYLQQQPQF